MYSAILYGTVPGRPDSGPVGIWPGNSRVDSAYHTNPFWYWKALASLSLELGSALTPNRTQSAAAHDNPYSEAQFKTMKYRPDYSDRFGCLVDARAWLQAFFSSYNQEHHHTGLGLLTPFVVHYRQAERVLQQRQETLQLVYTAHPERFVKGRPAAASLPPIVWINPPRLTDPESVVLPLAH